MRNAYQEQLQRLNTILGDMCELAGSAMSRATQALLQADLALAESVIADHDRMNRAGHAGRGAGVRGARAASARRG